MNFDWDGVAMKGKNKKSIVGLIVLFACLFMFVQVSLAAVFRESEKELAGLKLYSMTLTDAERIFGVPVSSEPISVKGPGKNGIINLMRTEFKRGIIASLVRDGKLWAIKVTDPIYPTSRGVKVGDSITEIYQAYGSPDGSGEFTHKWLNIQCIEHGYYMFEGYILVFVTDKSTQKIIEIGIHGFD